MYAQPEGWLTWAARKVGGRSDGVRQDHTFAVPKRRAESRSVMQSNVEPGAGETAPSKASHKLLQAGRVILDPKS